MSQYWNAVSFLSQTVLSYCHWNIAWDSSKSLSWSCGIADTVCSCPPFTDDLHTGNWTEIKNTTDVDTYNCDGTDEEMQGKTIKK